MLVSLFLEEKIEFLEIFESLRKLMDRLNVVFKNPPTELSFLVDMQEIDDSIKSDRWGREFIDQLFMNT